MNSPLIEQALAIIAGAEDKTALRELRMFLADCLEAGFEKAEIDNTRTMLLWLLFQQRLDPNFGKV